MNRRDLIKAGLAGGSVVAGGLIVADQLRRQEPVAPPERTPTPPEEEEPPTPTTEEPPERYEDEYGTVVDMVDVGADPSGQEPINALVQEHAGDDTVLTFPAGTFQLRPIRLVDYAHFGLAGSGDERPTLVSAPGECISGPYLRFDGVSDFLMEHVAFDFREPNTGGEIRIDADGDATVRDVRAGGSCEDQIALFRIDVRDENGTGLVENFHAENATNDLSLTCIYVGEAHAGELTFRNCQLRGFSDNGLYASSPGQEAGRNGVVHVDGGLYENNNVSNVRLGSTGSTARGVEIVADTQPAADSVNVRGIRLRERGDQLVEDCNILIGPESGYGFGGIVYHPANQGAVVRNTAIQVDRDYVPAVRAFPRSEGSSAQVFENLTITGGAARGFAAMIEGRDGTIFRNCTIEQTGEQRGGLRLAYSSDCEIVDCTIDVTAEPIVLRQSTAEVRNTTLRTPGGERYIDRLSADDEDFRPQ